MIDIKKTLTPKKNANTHIVFVFQRRIAGIDRQVGGESHSNQLCKRHKFADL